MILKQKQQRGNLFNEENKEEVVSFLEILQRQIIESENMALDTVELNDFTMNKYH